MIGNKYVKEELLASTRRANLYLCHEVHAESNKLVIKEFKQPTPAAFYESMMLQRANKDLKSPHISSYKGEFMQNSQYYLLTEYCAKGDLAGVIKNKNHKLYISDIAEYTRDLIMTLIGLHDIGIAHRDLKPENIFVTENNIIKLGDFGESVDCIGLEDEIDIQEIVGTPSYLPPDTRDPTKCDIWSLGKILYEMYIGDVHSILPMESQEELDNYIKINISQNRIPENFSNLLITMLQIDPKKAIESYELKSFFDEHLGDQLIEHYITMRQKEHTEEFLHPVECTNIDPSSESQENEQRPLCTLCKHTIHDNIESLSCRCHYHRDCLQELIHMDHMLGETVLKCVCKAPIDLKELENLPRIRSIVMPKLYAQKKVECPKCYTKSEKCKIDIHMQFYMIKCRHCLQQFCSFCESKTAHETCPDYELFIDQFELRSLINSR